MRTYLLVIFMRIVEAKLFGYPCGRHAEKLAHRLQSIPRMLITGIGIGLLYQGPKLRLKIELQVFSWFARATGELRLRTHVPREHFHQLLTHMLLEDRFGIDDFFSP